MEPFFSVLLSALFLGESPSIPIVLSLLPVVGGVALASATEVTFNWPGFLAAMGSNVTFQSRNVFSKKFMGKKKVSCSTRSPLRSASLLLLRLQRPPPCAYPSLLPPVFKVLAFSAS